MAMEKHLQFEKERVLVSGAQGFLGKELVRQLSALGAADVAAPSRADYDLTRKDDIERMLAVNRPTVIFHLAARCGGIEINRRNQGSFFYDNLMMGAQLMERARRIGVKKFICPGTICAYPQSAPNPFKEEDFWNGAPEETNAGFAWAKKMLLVQAQAYRKQYGFNAVFLLAGNVYGPEDHLEPDRSHVVSAMIAKFIDAAEGNRSEVMLWGDGSPRREFLYRDDAVRAFIFGAEYYDGAEPLNIITGEELSIKELAERIRELTGFKGRIVWDSSKPNGQLRRSLDTRRAQDLFGTFPKTSLREGLKKTIDWYRAHREPTYHPKSHAAY